MCSCFSSCLLQPSIGFPPWLTKSRPPIFKSFFKILSISIRHPTFSVLSHSSDSYKNSVDAEPWNKGTRPRLPENVFGLSPINFLERAAIVYRDSPAILYNDMCRSWSETHVRCRKLASSIVSLGIQEGDVVSVLAPNVPAMVELHFAIPMAGAVINNINLRLDDTMISNLLQHSESCLVFVDYQSLLVVQGALELFPGNMQRPRLVLIEEEEEEDDDKYSKASTRLEGNDHQILRYEALVENGNPGFIWIQPNSEWDPITLNYTSGTTSSPKGVVQSHRGAMLVSIDSLMSWFVPQQPVYLWTLPMFHINGWTFAWAMAAVGGFNVCLRHVDAASIYQAIERYKVTHMCGAPTVLNMLANHPGKKLLESPVHLMTAGAPPPAGLLRRAESLGFILTHSYGLTEVGGVVVHCAWKREWDKLPDSDRAALKARQGVGSIITEMDVVDPDSGASVPRDGTTTGEVVLRGGSLMIGYLKDPEGTAKCMTGDGWFHTGDVGVVHPDGYLEIKDRSKDIIIVGGENLSSVEIEAALYAHPAVYEAAVVGRPSKFWGETPCAYVSLKKEKGATEKEIREFCKEKLPLYMVPRTVVLVEELPKTSTGKIQKFILRKLANQSSNFPTSNWSVLK